VPRALTLQSYLGPNTLPAADALAAAMTHALDLPVRHATAAPDAGADITWACGLVTVRGMDDGRLDADIVAAPVFPGESGPVYRSVIVTRQGRPRPDAATRFAVNQVDSWSGHHALRAHLQHPIQTVETGSHVASVEAVRAGAADAAAIDSSVWAYLQEADSSLATDLVVVDRTIDWPAPPFAIARRLDPGLRVAVMEVLLATPVPGLTAIVPAADADYDPIRASFAALTSPED